MSTDQEATAPQDQTGEARYWANSDEGEIRRLRAALASAVAERDKAMKSRDALVFALDSITPERVALHDATLRMRSELILKCEELERSEARATRFRVALEEADQALNGDNADDALVIAGEIVSAVLAASQQPPPAEDVIWDLFDEIEALRAENERMGRGIVWAHYELAVNCKADTLWLMDLLDGLLAGKTADESADVARRTLAASHKACDWCGIQYVVPHWCSKVQPPASAGGSDDASE